MGRKKKAKGSALSDSIPHEVLDENKKEGAAFLAVCRGKVIRVNSTCQVV